MSFFFYVTYKLVRLKDKRLGVLYYVLAALALLYIVVEIFFRRGYMDFDTNPQGTIKLVLSDDFANSSLQAKDLSYCQGKTPCQFLDPWDLNWPSESRAVTIATLAKDRIQERAPVDGGGGRVEFTTSKENLYFTQGPEFVVIKVDHAVVATKFTDRVGKEALAASHRQLRGYLVDSNGRVIKTISPGPPKPGKADRITLGELLEAAGVQSLDQPADGLDARGRSYRERGCILRVTIFYQNWMSQWLGAGAIDYRYYVKKMPYVDYTSKQVEPILPEEEVLEAGGVHHAHWRLQRKRYSVRVEFTQAGSLAMLSLSTLVMKLVSGAALLTLIATITDALALYLLPNRQTYRDIVYEDSPDNLRHKNKTDNVKPHAREKQE